MTPLRRVKIRRRKRGSEMVRFSRWISPEAARIISDTATRLGVSDGLALDHLLSIASGRTKSQTVDSRTKPATLQSVPHP